MIPNRLRDVVRYYCSTKAFQAGLIFLACVVVGFVYYEWTWSPILAHRGGDNAYYLLTAQYFSPYSSPSLVTTYFATNNVYPPLYPFLLALFGGGESVLIAHLITTTFLLLVFIVFFLWLVSEGVKKFQSALLVLIFSALPVTYMQALAVQSENLYLLLSMLSVVFVTLSETKNQSYLWYAVIFIIASTMTRSAGITLVGAFVIYLYVNDIRGKHRLSLLLIGLFIMTKLLEKTKTVSYKDQLIKHYSSSPVSRLFENVQTEIYQLWGGWLGSFNNSYTLEVVLLIIGLLCIFGLIVRLRYRKFDAIYLLCYIVLVLVWPYPAEAQRFLFVILPLLLFYGLTAVKSIAENVKATKYSLYMQLTFLFSIVFAIVPPLLVTVKRYGEFLPDHLSSFRHQSDWYGPLEVSLATNYVTYNYTLFNDMNNIKALIPPDACVYNIKPSLVGFLSQRISKLPPSEDLNQKEFVDELLKNGCEYFYVVTFNSPSYVEHMYPLRRMENNIQIISSAITGIEKPAPLAALLGKVDLRTLK